MTREETTKFLSDLAEKLINPHNDPRVYWASLKDHGEISGHQGLRSHRKRKAVRLIPERMRYLFRGKRV